MIYEKKASIEHLNRNNINHVCNTVMCKNMGMKDLIIDSAKAYFKLELGLEAFIQKLVIQAESLGKNGVSVLTDCGSFSLFEEREKLVDYELLLPSKYDHGID